MPEEVFILNETLQALLSAMSVDNQPEDLTMDANRRLLINAYSRLVGQDSNGNNFQIFLEDTGEQKVVIYGKDASSNIDPLRTNASQELVVDVSGTAPIGRKVLGQAATLAATETELYVVPASTEAEVTMLSVANRGSSELTFRIGLSVGGGALADEDYIVYDIPLPSKNAYVHAAPIYLATADEILVYASTADATFAATGLEYTR